MKLQTTVKVNGEVYALFDTMREAVRFMKYWLTDPAHKKDVVSIK